MTKSGACRQRIQRIEDNNGDLQKSNRRRGLLALGGGGRGRNSSSDEMNISHGVAAPVKPNFSLMSLDVGGEDEKETLLQQLHRTNFFNEKEQSQSQSSQQRDIGGYGKNPFGASSNEERGENENDDDDDRMRRFSQGFVELMVRSPEKMQEDVLGRADSSEMDDDDSGRDEDEDRQEREEKKRGEKFDDDDSNTKENEESGRESGSMGTRTSSEAPLYKFRISMGDQQKGTPPRLSYKGRTSGATKSMLATPKEEAAMEEEEEEEDQDPVDVSMFNFRR